jgi:hypothetical protein
MRAAIVGPMVLLAVAVTVIMSARAGQGGKPAQPAQPAQSHPAPLQGRVVTREAVKLRRFATPISVAPALHPLPIVGHSWHWHVNYGWVALPIGTVQTAVLPATYVLPAQVQYYETATVAAVQCVCPHCGQPITVTVN